MSLCCPQEDLFEQVYTKAIGVPRKRSEHWYVFQSEYTDDIVLQKGTDHHVLVSKSFSVLKEMVELQSEELARERLMDFEQDLQNSVDGCWATIQDWYLVEFPGLWIPRGPTRDELIYWAVAHCKGKPVVLTNDCNTLAGSKPTVGKYNDLRSMIAALTKYEFSMVFDNKHDLMLAKLTWS